MDSGRHETTWRLGEAPVTGLALAPDEGAALVGTEAGKLFLVDVPSGALRRELPAHAGCVTGVGLAAVQLGAQLGASVTAVASSAEKLDVAAGYGAKNLVNHKSADLRCALKEAVPAGADAVVDPVGGELSEPALRSLGRGGRFVTVGFASGVIPRIPLNLVLMKGVHVVGFQFQDVPPDEFARNEEELREHLVGGRVQPHVCATYPLAETVAALRHVADGHAIGKVLIDLT